MKPQENNNPYNIREINYSVNDSFKRPQISIQTKAETDKLEAKAESINIQNPQLRVELLNEKESENLKKKAMTKLLLSSERFGDDANFLLKNSDKVIFRSDDGHTVFVPEYKAKIYAAQNPTATQIPDTKKYVNDALETLSKQYTQEEYLKGKPEYAKRLDDLYKTFTPETKGKARAEAVNNLYEDIYGEEVGQAIENQITLIDESIAKYREKLEDDYVDDIKTGKTTALSRFLGSYKSSELRNLNLAEDLIGRIKDELRARKNQSGFWRSVIVDTNWSNILTADIESIYDAATERNLFKRLDQYGIDNLREDEKLLLDALVAGEAIKNYPKELTTLYKVGTTIVPSLFFMASYGASKFLLKGVKSGVKKIAEAALKKYIKQRTKELGVKTATEAAKKTFTQKAKDIAVRTGKELATSAAQAPLMPTYWANRIERHNGDIQITTDGFGENTTYMYDGREISNTPEYDAYMATLIDIASEKAGALIPFGKLNLGKYIGKAIPGDSKFWQNTRKFISGVGGNRLKRAVDFNGFVGEYSEELIAGTLNSMLVGDQKIEDVFAKQNMIETALSVGVISLGMGLVSGGLSIPASKKVKKEFLAAEEELKKVIPSPREREKFIREVATAGYEQQAAVMNKFVQAAENARKSGDMESSATYIEAANIIGRYMNAYNRYQTYNSYLDEQIKEKLETEKSAIQEATNPDMDNNIVVADYYGKNVKVVAGKVEFNEDGTVNTENSSESIVILNDDGSKQQVSPQGLTLKDMYESSELEAEAEARIRNEVQMQSDAATAEGKREYLTDEQAAYIRELGIHGIEVDDELDAYYTEDPQLSLVVAEARQRYPGTPNIGQQAQSAPEQEQMQAQYPRDAKGNPDFAQITPEQATQILTTEYPEDYAEFVQNKVAAAEKRIEKASKAKPQSTDLSDIKAEREAIRAEQTAAQQEYDYWNNVKTLLNRQDVNTTEQIAEEQPADANLSVAENETLQPRQTVEETTAAKQEEQQQYPTDEAGEPLWYDMTDEQFDVAMTELGDDADAFIADNIKEAQKSIKKAEKAKPKSSEFAKRKAEQQAISAEKAAAQKAYDYWTAQQARRIGASQRKAPQVTQQVGENITGKYQTSNRTYGNADTYILPNGEKINGRYVIVEADAITPSHDANNGYQKSEGFPTDENGNTINDRDYQADKSAQTIVEQNAANYDARAIQTPVIVTNQGIVLSGNGRTMSGQIAASQGTDTEYLSYLKDHAGRYGFTAEQISGYQHPRLVLEVSDNVPLNAETFAKFNAEDKKTISPTEKAVKAGKTVTDITLEKIAALLDDKESLSDVYADEAATAQIIKILQSDGVINSNEVSELMDGNNLSAQGKEFFETLLVGKILNEQNVRLVSQMRNVRATVIKSIMPLLSNSRLKNGQNGENYSLNNELNSAIELIYAANKADMPLIDYMAQTKLFEDNPADIYDEAAKIIAMAITKGQNNFKSFVNNYNAIAESAASGQIDIFAGGIKTKEDILKEIVPIYGNTGQKTTDTTGRRENPENPDVGNGLSPDDAGNRGTADTGGRGIGPDGNSRGSRDSRRSGQISTNPAIGESNKAVRTGMTREEALSIVASMEEHAEVAPELALTPENWVREFGEDGIVNTPIGEVKMGDHQYAKMMRQNRNGKLGMVKPTLENPDIIVEDISEAKDGDITERGSSYVFVKAFTKLDGSRYYYFTSVTIRKDGHEVVVSNQEKRRNVLTNLLVNGKLAWKHADNVSVASDVANGLYSSQGNVSDPAIEGTDAPQTNYSENKDSKESPDIQEADNKNSNLSENEVRNATSPSGGDSNLSDIEERYRESGEPVSPETLAKDRAELEEIFGASFFANVSETVKKRTAERMAAVSKAAKEFKAELKNAPEIVLISDINDIPKYDTQAKTIDDVYRRMKAKGWYSPGNGKIYVNLASHLTPEDVKATILHEAVGHSGLRRLLGKDAFDRLCNTVYQSLPEDTRKKKLEEARETHPGATDEQLHLIVGDEYMATLAEGGAEQSIPQRIISAVRDFLRSIGIDLEINEADLRYLLHASYKNIKDADAVTVVNNSALLARLRKAAEETHIKSEAESLFRLGKKSRDAYERLLEEKRPDMPDAMRQEALNYLDNLEDSKANTKKIKIAVKWLADGTIRLPEDADKVDMAIEYANRKGIDAMQYNSPLDLIDALKGHVEIKDKPIDPDTVKELSNKVDYGDGLTVYDVEDSEAGRQAMRQIINTHFGKDASPWCLLQGDSEGNLTSQSAQYWQHYNAYPKRVAFKDGKLLAFFANDEDTPVWWDRLDRPNYDGIPVTGKIKGDPLGRTATRMFDENTKTYGQPLDIHKGNKQNGTYEAWHPNGQMRVRAHYKNGIPVGSYESWYENGNPLVKASYNEKGEYDGLYEDWFEDGQQRSRINYKDGVLDGLYKLWYENGQIYESSNYKDGKYIGLRTVWFENGQQLLRDNYKDGILDGLSEVWYENGQRKSKVNYNNGREDGLYERWYENGQRKSKVNYNNGKRDGLYESWHINGQIETRTYYKNGKENGICEQWDYYGEPILKELYENGVLKETLPLDDSILFRLGDTNKTFSERVNKAVENKGIVMPNLAEEKLKVINIPKHNYKGSAIEAKKQAVKDAKKKYQGKTLYYDNYGTAFDYTISGESIEKSISKKATDKSTNIGIHIAVLNRLDEVIANSIEVEEHPDYKKGADGERRPENGYNANTLIHRFYGAIKIGGIVYRVKTTMKESRSAIESNKQYSYEVTNVELLNASASSSSNGVGGFTSSREDTLPLAKVIEKETKSYEKWKKVLDASREIDIRFRMDNDLEEVNRRFNEELEQQISGTLPQGHIYKLGRPGKILRSTGIPDLPIEMSSKMLKEHSEAAKHPFNISDLRNLIYTIQKPIAIFKYGNPQKSQNLILGIEQNGKNYLVGVHFNQKRKELIVSDIRGIFPKNNAEWLNWINQDKLLYADKEKIQELINKQRKTLAEVEYLDLDSIANIIKNFENPNFETEKNIEDIRFRLDTPEEQQVSMASEASERTYTETDKAPEIDYDMPATEVIEQISAKSSVEPLFRQGAFDKDFAAIVALQDAIKQTSLYQQNASSKELANRLNVGLYDAMAPLKDFISQIEESRGQKIDDHNPYYLENASASKAQERIESLKRDNIKPLAETTNDAAQLLQGREMLKLYLMGKTGLERQEVKEASQQNEGFYDFAGLTGLQRMLIIQQIGEANITDEVITTLNGLDYPQLLDYANEHNYQTIDKYVETCDKKLGDTGITLWEQIRDLSKKQLRGQYDAGLISRDAYYYLTTGIRISDLLAANRDNGIISDKKYNNISDTDMDVSELRDKGYITQQQYDMLNTYKPLYMYYLPLKGDASITASDINDYESREQKNKSKISKVKGHENLTRDPLTQLVSDCYGAIQNEEHNRWLREVLRAARLSNLSDNVVKITPLNVGATRVATEGETAAKQGKKRNERLIADVKATNKQVDEHSVIVFDGGRAYKMTFADLSLAKALRTSGGRFADASAFVNWASRKTRSWAMMLTTLNPMFVASNTFRDVGEALFVNYVNLGAKAIPVFVRAWNPANELQKAVHRHLKGKPGNTPYDALVKEYFDNGGPTSFSMLPDFDKIKSDMDKMVRDSKRGNHNPIKMTKTVLDWLEVQARHSELLSRVATYAMYRGTLPEYNIGKNASITEAIWQSKEVTVNFDKRGAWAKELGVTSLFWNAGRQSNRIHYNLLKNHPVRYLAATAAMSSIKVALPGLLSTLVSYLYGDDEKGKEYLDKYYAINRYTRYNNLCLLWGDAIVKIPISPSFGPTAIMSEIVSEMIYTDFDKDRALSMTADLAQSMATLVGNDIFGSVVGAIAKGEPKELIGAIPFAIAQPFAELLANRNWQGRQIMRDYQGLDYLPAYYKAYGNVEDYYIESAKWINKITGGDEGKPGKLNKLIGNPAANKHIIESYLGGLGSFIFDSLNTGANIVNGRWDRVVAESPFKRFLGDPEVYQDQEAWEDYYSVKSKINELSTRINSYKQSGNERKAYKLEDVRDELKYLLKPYDDYIDASKEDMQEALNRNPKDAREIRRKHRRDMAKYLKTLKKQIEHIDTDL